jgi:hypothetical protein
MCDLNMVNIFRLRDFKHLEGEYTSPSGNELSDISLDLPHFYIRETCRSSVIHKGPSNPRVRILEGRGLVIVLSGVVPQIGQGEQPQKTTTFPGSNVPNDF